jgi:type IV pilus assembly protein PilA
MLARIRKAAEEREGGFTLIELLVVIIIIGILAAIAIPVFLNQRNKGYDAQAKSDLRNMATAEETWLTDNNVYTTSVANLQTVGFKPSATPTDSVVSVRGANSSDSYCMKSVSKSGTSFYYDSAAGGVSTTACT